MRHGSGHRTSALDDSVVAPYPTHPVKDRGIFLHPEVVEASGKREQREKLLHPRMGCLENARNRLQSEFPLGTNPDRACAYPYLRCRLLRQKVRHDRSAR